MNEKEIYHPISYIVSGGHLWELDGLKRGPLKLGNQHITYNILNFYTQAMLYNRIMQ
jgi:hypothetical protein